MPRTLSMPFHRAKMMAQAILPHVSNDDVTPVLTVAVVRGEHIIGTDRYSVGEFLLQGRKPKEFDQWSEDQRKGWEENHTVRQEGVLEDGDPTWADDFTIPRAALLRISTLSKAQTMHGLFPEHRIIVREEFGEWRQSSSPVVARRDPSARARDRFIVVEVVIGSTVEFAQRFAVPSGNFPPVGRLFADWAPQEEGGAVQFGLMGSNIEKIVRFAGKHTPFRMTAGRTKPGEQMRLAPMLVEVGDDFRALIQPTLTMR